jgi:hypothetical protein
LLLCFSFIPELLLFSFWNNSGIKLKHNIQRRGITLFGLRLKHNIKRRGITLV